MTFKKFNQPIFDGEGMDPWVMEIWTDSMEILFEDLYTLERDKIHLIAHCIKKSVKVWWKGVRRDRPSNLPLITWDMSSGD